MNIAYNDKLFDKWFCRPDGCNSVIYNASQKSIDDHMLVFHKIAIRKIVLYRIKSTHTHGPELFWTKQDLFKYMKDRAANGHTDDIAGYIIYKTETKV